MTAVLNVSIPGAKRIRSGKVRELFAAGEDLLIVATDRISAFDCILSPGIPGKGKVLTQLSAFWFRYFSDVPSHFLSVDPQRFPAPFTPFYDLLAGRSMLVKQAEPLPVECVVRGYLAGSAWREYQEKGTVAGISQPSQLKLGSRFPQPLFTPASKADSGHDENLTWEQFEKSVGPDRATRLRELSISLYRRGSEYAQRRGVIIADTKFEFGIRNAEVILIDECLTPDSSRFWPASSYMPGVNPPSYDKQFVRDYLESVDWDKRDPAPTLPPEVVEKTAVKYREALESLTRSGD
ncbi:MAG TPA: phosphoribosylaminoimidazolesuccinocarboxamide synthase [Chthoniobacterales bacterium]|nr:phosphoribosylaminoimidazolesuccinocarboxamide synthase [Chthoniobacterales bacterium]